MRGMALANSNNFLLWGCLMRVRNTSSAASLIAFVLFSAASMPAAQSIRYFPHGKNRAHGVSQPPAITVVNSASFLPGVCPGSLATIFGQNLTYSSGLELASTIPLPLELAGVQVLVNGLPAGIFSVYDNNGQDQISFQVPWETDTGPGAAQITILNSGDTVGTAQVDSYTEDPGVFVSNGYAVAVLPDYSLIAPSNPAYPGDTIILYTTGLGPVSPPVADGEAGPSSLSITQDPFQVVVNGEPCQVSFSGLAPGFVGVYQLNVVLPDDLPPGDLDIQITSSYASSNTTQISVSQ